MILIKRLLDRLRPGRSRIRYNRGGIVGPGGAHSLPGLPDPHLIRSPRQITMMIKPGTPEFGIWCPSCLLPAAIRVPYKIIDIARPAGARLVKAGAFEHCPDCRIIRKATDDA